MPSSRTSVSSEPYRPAWWLRNAHLQTLWGPLLRRPPEVHTVLEHWKMPDGDSVGVERLVAEPGAPRLVILHGLEGSSRSPYVRGMLAGAQSLSWSASVLIFRGCGEQPNNARRFYHSGETTDLHDVLRRIRAEDPNAPLLLAGFSLGGNVLLKWLGEHGADAGIIAAAAVSVPFDLERGARHLHKGFARIYERNFLVSLKRKALAKRARFPDLPSREAVTSARSIFDFDDRVTAPVHGFLDAPDYYTRSSALRWLSGISVPTLLLSARDDPFLPPSVLDEVAGAAASNTHLNLEVVRSGGHVGFVEGAFPWRARYYAERRVLAFLQTALTAFRDALCAGTLPPPPSYETRSA